jgi:hypothetical protein
MDTDLDKLKEPRWVLWLVAAGVSALLTTVGVGMVFIMPLPMHPGLVRLLNPGGILVALIWPAGPHSGGLLAAFSPLVFVAADLVVWWILVYLAVLAFAKWFWHRHGGAMK